ncbi:MAG: hypothetical protein ACRERD_12565, partial [Candidatus Binatia bacterium]
TYPVRPERSAAKSKAAATAGASTLPLTRRRSARTDIGYMQMKTALDDKRGQGALADWMVAPERGRGGVQRLEATLHFSPTGKSLDLETAIL